MLKSAMVAEQGADEVRVLVEVHQQVLHAAQRPGALEKGEADVEQGVGVASRRPGGVLGGELQAWTPGRGTGRAPSPAPGGAGWPPPRCPCPRCGPRPPRSSRGTWAPGNSSKRPLEATALAKVVAEVRRIGQPALLDAGVQPRQRLDGETERPRHVGRPPVRQGHLDNFPFCCSFPMLHVCFLIKRLYNYKSNMDWNLNGGNQSTTFEKRASSHQAAMSATWI